MDDIEELWALLQEFEEYWNQQQEKRPFHLNLLEYCRTYENAHTQILLQILRCKENGNFSLIDSFLRNLDIDIQWINTNTKIEFNKDFIDGYLCDGTHAIIIENKINNAIDQDHQIENYVNKVKERGFDLGKIYVFYLTKDGSKQVSQISCPNSLKNDLGERFVEINYRDYILPWLKDDVLPRCKVKDEIFISALRQYIDFLEGMFGFRKGDEKMDDEIVEKIKLWMSFKEGSWGHCKLIEEKIKVLDELKKYLDKIQHEVVNSIVAITGDYWNKKYEVENSTADGTRGPYKFLYFGNPRWNTNEYLIHLEWNPITEEILFNNSKLTLHLHFERNIQNYISYLKKDVAFIDKVKDVGMTYENSKDSNIKHNYQKIVEFEKPLAAMTKDERTKALSREYDIVKPLLDYVYSKCEKLDSLSTQ